MSGYSKFNYSTTMEMLEERLGSDWKQRLGVEFNFKVFNNYSKERLARQHQFSCENIASTVSSMKTRGSLEEFFKLSDNHKIKILNSLSAIATSRNFKGYLQALDLAGNPSPFSFNKALDGYVTLLFEDTEHSSRIELIDVSAIYENYRKLSKSVTVEGRNFSPGFEETLFLLRYSFGESTMIEIMTAVSKNNLKLSADQFVFLTKNWPNFRDQPIVWTLELYESN